MFHRRSKIFLAITLASLVAATGCNNSSSNSNASNDASIALLPPEQQFSAYLKLAQAGQSQAQTKVADMLLNGKGTPKDEAKAVEWFNKAAEQGDVPAMLMLAEAYSQTFGKDRFRSIEADTQLATKWYLQAASKGSSEAAYMLGVAQDPRAKHQFLAPTLMYDVSKAIEYYLTAADKGNAKAMSQMSWHYAEGLGVPRDGLKALNWLQRSAAEGDLVSQERLGMFYSDNKTGRGWRMEWGVSPSPNLILAYAWTNLAIAGGKTHLTSFRDQIGREMSPNQVAIAERISSNWTKGQILGQDTQADVPPVAQSGRRGTGTLFFVNANQAITNHHVVANCPSLRLQGTDKKVTVLTEDRVNDLALLSIEGGADAVAQITADPTKLRQGDDIVTFGYPLNSVLSSGGNLTPGVVSGLTGLGNNSGQIQITAAIQPGSSGSPVLNRKGEVVGVVVMKLDDKKMVQATGQIGQTVNFAISGQTLTTFLNANHVQYTAGTGFFSREKSAADIADQARKWTSVIECWAR